jgi:hypothetical protein
MFPQFLSDGRHFLFFATGTPEARGVHIGQLGEASSTRLFDADGPAVYTPTGHLLFIREGKLLSQGFDAERLELTGDSYAITDEVSRGTTLSAATDGTIAYRTASPGSGQRQLVWADRSGREFDRVVYDDSAALGASLSDDGRRVAVYRFQNGNMDVWSYDINRRAWDRITSHAGDDIYPTWSRDGTSIVTGSVRSERILPLLECARSRFRELGYTNIETLHDNGSLGWPGHAPYDAIVAAAAAPEVPPRLRDQLKPGGRLVLPIGDRARLQTLICEQHNGADGFSRQVMGEVRFVPLVTTADWRTSF